MRQTWLKNKRNRDKEKLIVGVDNGLDGGLCAIGADSGLIYSVSYMPTDKVGTTGREVSAKWLDQLFTDLCCPHTTVIEQPLKHARSSQAMRSMGISFGTTRAVALTHGDCEEVVCYYPTDWQKPMMGKFPRGMSKVYAEKTARGLQPRFEWETKRTPRSKKAAHDGIVDAYLVAEWHRRQLFS